MTGHVNLESHGDANRVGRTVVAGIAVAVDIRKGAGGAATRGEQPPVGTIQRITLCVTLFMG